MRALSDPLARAWGKLVALSLASTAIAGLVGREALTGQAVTVAGGVILALAWAKARVILDRYLGLAAAPFWHRGFSIVLALYCLGLLALYLIG